ncbi:MAG: DUF3991 and TOPRIM domain-containing protein, partial [Cyanobacteria bacterium J06648_11]
MMDRRNELEDFKTAIDLRFFAAHAFSYQLDRRASSPNSALMVGASGDKIIIARGQDGHHVYFAVGDHTDSGSIIDFCQKRGAGSLGEVRKLLRRYIGQAATALPERTRFGAPLRPIERDMAAVRAAWEGMEPLEDGHHPYLNADRGLTQALLAQPRFASCIRRDARGNAVFAHLNRDGICGFELKNTSFTGFSKGGAKGLWASGTTQADTALVIAESAIDALSHAALHPSPTARYVSLAGQTSPEQLALVEAAMRKLPSGTVTLAFD